MNITRFALLPALAATLACAFPSGADVLKLTTNFTEYQVSDRDAVTVNIERVDPEPGVESVDWRWHLSDIDGVTVDSGTLRLTDGTAELIIRLPFCGYYQITVTGVDERGATVLQAETPVARVHYAKNLAADPGGYFGINGHCEYEHAPFLRRLGATMWRADYLWEWVEPSEGTYDFTFLDKVTDELIGNGFEILVNLNYNPSWLKLAPGQGTDREKYFAYVRQVVTRYRDRISHWNFWNEPYNSWHGDLLEFADMQLEAFRIIKSIQPEAEVVFDGFPFEQELRGYTLPQLEHLDWQAPMTVLGMHPYNRPQGPDDNDFLLHMRNIIRIMQQKLPGVSVWISELGWPVSSDYSGVSERAQASNLVRSAVYGLAAGCGKYIYYKHSSGPNQAYHEDQYGMLTDGGVPRMSLPVYAFFAQTLRPLRFERMLELGPAVSGAAFRGEGDQGAIVVWARHDPVMLRIRPMGTDTEWFRADGSPFRFAADDGELGLNDLPVVAVSARLPELAAALEAAQITLKNPLGLEGASLTGDGLLIRLANRTRDPLNVAARLTLPEGADFRDPARKGDRPTEVSFRVTSHPKEILFRLDPMPAMADGKLPLDLSTGDTQQCWQLPWRLYPIRSSASEAGPDIMLNQVASIMPSDQQKEWKGPDDLSVPEARATWDERGLHFRATVRDDLHDGPEPGSNAPWNKDFLQLAVQCTPGIAPAFYDEHSLEIGAGLEKGGAVRRIVSAGGNGVEPEAVVTRDEAAKLTTYTLSVPWRALGLDAPPEPGSVIGMTFLVNDSDGNQLRKWIELSPGIGLVKNPAEFPRFRFEK